MTAEDASGNQPLSQTIIVSGQASIGSLTSIANAHDIYIAGVDPDALQTLLARRQPSPVEPWKLGDLPRVWNVPHLRNPNFTGREELLEQLRVALTSGQPAALTQALAGLGGIGKTQLAIEYAYRHATNYEVVWWVWAEEPMTLAADYALLARELHLPEQDQTDQSVVVAAVQGWLRHRRHWLLVFDNAREPAEVSPYLVHGGVGHMLITTRNPTWRAVARPVPVHVLGRDEAVAFLLNRTGQADHKAASALAEALGDLPLALEQAGAYIETTGRGFGEYTDLFRKRAMQVLQSRPGTDYPATVVTTWSLAFEKVRRAAGAVELLMLCAFLASDAIPLELIRRGREHLPIGSELADVAGDDLQWDEALAMLRRYSLIEVSGRALALHRLVQLVQRENLPENDRRSWAVAAVRMVNAATPNVEVQTWPVYAELMPHALAAAGYAEALHIRDRLLGRLLNQIGVYLQERAQLTEAKGLLERALAIREQVLGPNHPVTATSLNDLGLVLQKQGDLAGARTYFERTLAINQRLNAEHSDTAAVLNNLGMVLQSQGELAGARSYYEQALAIYERELSIDHSSAGNTLNNLGTLLMSQGDLNAARPCLERAFAIAEQKLPPDEAAIASSLNNLGVLLKAQGDPVGARSHFEHALAIRERVLGPDHLDTATSLDNLGGLLRERGDVAGARLYLERALTIHERALGPDHPDTANSLTQLAAALQVQGDLVRARSYFERALPIRQKTADSKQEAAIFFYLGLLAVQLGHSVEGVRLVLLSSVIDKEIGSTDTSQAEAEFGEAASRLGWTQADLVSEIGKVADIYKVDRGLGLVRAAFADIEQRTARQRKGRKRRRR